MRTVLTLAAALSLTGCMMGDFGSSDRFQTDFHYSWELRPGGHINVESFNGSVEITGWDENRVEVTGTKYASTEEVRDQIKIETRNSPELVELRAVKPSTHFGNMGARFTIHAPRTAIADRVTTSNGAIRVRDLASTPRLKTSNGSIRAENVGGNLDARTSNGAIDVDSSGGDLVLNTSNGRIHAENILGACDASSSNGSVDLDFRKAPKSDVHAHTSNGGVSLHLPAGTNARVEAHTSNSGVTSDFDLAGRDSESRNHAEGNIGSGGPLLRLESSNGHIRITKGGAE